MTNFEIKMLTKEGFTENEILDIYHCTETNPTITFINENLNLIIIYTSKNTIEEIQTILENIIDNRGIEYFTIEDIRIRDVQYLKKLVEELEEKE